MVLGFGLVWFVSGFWSGMVWFWVLMDLVWYGSGFWSSMVLGFGGSCLVWYVVQVSELGQGVYLLKQAYFSTIAVDQWPFYTDAQRQMLKRVVYSKNYGSQGTSSEADNKEELVMSSNKVC